MSLDSTSQVAQVINSIASEQQDIKESYADEGDASFLMAPFESVKMTGEVDVYKRTISGVLVVGHVVYGEVYVYPVFMPMTLGHPVWGVLGSGYLSGTATYDKLLVETINF